DVTSSVQQAVERLGTIDVLVNNAAIYPRSPLLELDEATWDRVIDVNLKGVFLCSQAVARAMVSQHRPGVILNITSGSAFRPTRRAIHYGASKAGVVDMTRNMALELASHGIRVNAISPGLTDTAQPREGMTEDEFAAIGREIPL